MSSGAGAQWRWPESELRRIGYQVADLIAGYLSGIDGQPAFRPFPAELARALELAAPPEAGRTADEVLAEFRETVLPYPFGNGHPRFWGWVNSPPSVMGVFADALAAAMNPSCAGGNHAAGSRRSADWEKHLVFPPIRDRDGRTVFRMIHPVGFPILVDDSCGHRACLFR